MTELNLEANTEEQKIIKEYLEENASEILADKINNGVNIEKDGKTLINKKTLDGFMKYATSEAKKQAAKGASSACVRSDVVFGWAIHYFEEESIEGDLYNEDGTEYKPAPKVIPKPITPPVVKEVKPPEPKNVQQSMLDMFDFDVPEREEEAETEIAKEEPLPPPRVEKIGNLSVNTTTGEVLEETETKADEKDPIAILKSIFGDELEINL